MASSGLHISISAEEIFSVGNFPVTNSIFTSLIISVMILGMAFLLRARLSSNLSKPSKFQNFFEWLVESFYSLVYGVTNNHAKSRVFTPIIMSFFLFILLNNWFGLLPGVGTINTIVSEDSPEEIHESTESSSNLLNNDKQVYAAEELANSQDDPKSESHGEKHVPIFRPGTADLNTTIALALFSVLATQVVGFKYQKFSYFKKFINFSSPIMFFVGVLELISEFAKIISFAFRLFGNIFAGEVLLVVIAFLLPIIVPMPFYGLEIFVGFIQALVFSLLTLVFFNMATVGHDDH